MGHRRIKKICCGELQKWQTGPWNSEKIFTQNCSPYVLINQSIVLSFCNWLLLLMLMIIGL